MTKKVLPVCQKREHGSRKHVFVQASQKLLIWTLSFIFLFLSPGLGKNKPYSYTTNLVFFFLKTTKSDIKTHRSSLMILLCPPQTRHSPHAWLPQQTALIRPPHLGKGRKVITPVTKVPTFPFSSCCRLSGGRCSYIYSRPTSPQHGQAVGKQAQGRLIRKAHYTCSRRQTPSCQAGGMM